MGLSNSLATFMSSINNFLSDMLDRGVVLSWVMYRTRAIIEGCIQEFARKVVSLQVKEVLALQEQDHFLGP